MILDVMGGDVWVWGLLIFPLLKLQPLRGVGVGLAGKGGMVGSRTKLSFGRYEASGGVWRSRLAKESGPNEQD
eukprot:scaffold457_cov50-Attheya_sp.AAC.5